MNDKELRKYLEDLLLNKLRKKGRPASMSEAARILDLDIPHPTEEILQSAIDDLDLVEAKINVYALIYRSPPITKLPDDRNSRPLARLLCTMFHPSTEVNLKEILINEKSIEKGHRRKDFTNKYNFYVTHDLPKQFLFPLLEVLYNTIDDMRGAYLVKGLPKPRVNNLKRIVKEKEKRSAEREQRLREELSANYGELKFSPPKCDGLPPEYRALIRRIDRVLSYTKEHGWDETLRKLFDRELDGAKIFDYPEIRHHPKYMEFMKLLQKRLAQRPSGSLCFKYTE